jgi:hypothetical protein
MKKQYSLLAVLLCMSVLTFAQALAPAKFTVRVSTDSVLMGNNFQVSFTLENADGINFKAPELAAYFDVASGPNTSSSMTMMNGQVSKSVTYTYYLSPREVGVFYIEPASIETENNYMETAPLEVMVVPNPDGIQQNQPSMQGFGTMPEMRGFDSFGGFNSLQEMQQQMQQLFEGKGNIFDLFPGDMQQMMPDSSFFALPPNMNFFQMNPDSLFQQMPEEWKKMFPDGFTPVDPKKKKRKIYKM